MALIRPDMVEKPDKARYGFSDFADTEAVSADVYQRPTAGKPATYNTRIAQ
jgi:hypothetical protein